MKDRFRWAVAVIEPSGKDYHFRYIVSGSEFQTLNGGRTFDEIERLGYAGYPAFSLRKLDHTEEILDIFLRRLPPRSRPDFEEYKRQFRFPVDIKPSDFALLGYTEAKLPSDGFSLVDPLDPSAIDCDLMLEIAGFRYYCEGVPGISVGWKLEIAPEPENQFDPGAVQFCLDGKKIGNINRLQAPTFLSWLKHRTVSGLIERLNGNTQRPRAFVFVQVRPLHEWAAPR